MSKMTANLDTLRNALNTQSHYILNTCHENQEN